MDPTPPPIDLATHNSGTQLMEWCSRSASTFDDQARKARAGQPPTAEQQAAVLDHLAELCRRIQGHTHMGLMRSPRPWWIVRVWRAICAA